MRFLWFFGARRAPLCFRCFRLFLSLFLYLNLSHFCYFSESFSYFPESFFKFESFSAYLSLFSTFLSLFPTFLSLFLSPFLFFWVFWLFLLYPIFLSLFLLFWVIYSFSESFSKFHQWFSIHYKQFIMTSFVLLQKVLGPC